MSKNWLLLAIVFVSTHAVFCTATMAQSITHVPLYTIYGDSADDGFGSSSANAGDVNNDGRDDFIVGASGDDNNGSRSGSATIYSGSDGSVLYSFNGNSSLDFFGNSVDGAGDVNGDGHDDVIVGAFYDVQNGVRAGSALVISGIDGSTLYTLVGEASGDDFGRRVKGAGDVNNDGYADVIVGAPFSDPNGDNSGSAYVFSGIDGSVLYRFDGQREDHWFGDSVSGAGDVNGDGYDDLIVGVRNDDVGTGRLGYGSAYVFSGVDGSELYKFEGGAHGNWFGDCVNGAGDVNNDGFDDVIVGAPRENWDVGTARVFSGADGSTLHTFRGTDSNGFFGSWGDGVGDINNDGFDDVSVGAIYADRARIFSGADGSLLYSILGDEDRDDFGFPVTSAGDINNDGIPDFIVGAEDGGDEEQGYARVFVSQVHMLADNVIVGNGAPQRSMVTEISVRFGSSITVTEGAFELIKRGQDGGSVELTVEVDDSDVQDRAILTFAGAFTEASGSLVDGNYQLTINGDLITAEGAALDVDGDGTPGGLLVIGDQEAEALYRLFADSDQNRRVNVIDLLGFRQTYLMMTGDASFDMTFDSNLDGVINVLDLLRLRQNYLKFLPFADSSKSRSGKTLLKDNRSNEVKLQR